MSETMYRGYLGDRYPHDTPQVVVKNFAKNNFRLWFRGIRRAGDEKKHPARLDLPGFKNLEGLYIG